ncbi:MAG: cobalt-precorrin-6A reductase [Sphingobium sp.]
MGPILILGGTTEASALAAALARRGDRVVLSYAGRTARPRAQPVPIRIGGFGGADGLAAYLREQGIRYLVDATHPFAATMSGNAIAASARAAVPLIALTRPAWVPVEGDRWMHVPDIAAAIAALNGPTRRVMLALGRMHADAFSAQPQHHYLLRFVDAPAVLPSLPDHRLVIDRGPFTVTSDLALMRENAIDLVVAKNAGGTGAAAKLEAARALGLPIIMIDRPSIADRHTVHDVGQVLRWIDHGVDRGV